MRSLIPFLPAVFALLLVACLGEHDAARRDVSAETPPPVTATMQPTRAVVTPTTAPPTFESPAAQLPNLGRAPLIANEVWLNTEQPLSLDDLRGKVVLVEFWTFG